MTRDPRRIPSRTSAHSQIGVTLVELMVTLTIGMIIVGAISALFIGATRTRSEVESTADTIEAGRYATDLLTRELSLAGYYGTLSAPSGNATANIPCSVTPADWAGSLEVHVFGWNQDAGDPVCDGNRLINRKPGTDAIFIQRASTCETGVASCEAESSASAYLQVSECGDTYNAHPFDLAQGRDSGSGSAGTTFKLQTKTCAAAIAPLRKFIRGIYYVDENDTLTFREIGPAGARTPVPLVENIEQMQLSYALDTDGDGAPDSYNPSPAAAAWPDVIGVRVWLIARSAREDDKPIAAPVFSTDANPADGVDLTKSFRRRVSTTYIAFGSPTLRRAK